MLRISSVSRRISASTAPSIALQCRSHPQLRRTLPKIKKRPKGRLIKIQHPASCVLPRHGPTATIVEQLLGSDFEFSGVTADTPSLCFPITNAILGLLDLIKFVFPLAPAGTAIVNSKRSMPGTEISNTSNFATQPVVTVAVQAGVFVKS